MKKELKKKVSKIPPKPGVYLFSDKGKKVLYVGKANNLKSRVKSYFQKGSTLTPDKKIMVSRIEDFDYIIVNSEIEALLLESSLIKKYRPPYNITFKDDKYFLYIKITTSETFPKISLVRKIISSKDTYFGPFTSARATRNTLKILKDIFPLCDNPPSSKKKTKEPCFRYHLNQCAGACVGKISSSQYREIIQQVIHFLKGQEKIILKELKSRMEKAAALKNYEKAALLRDQIRDIEKVITPQQVISTKEENEDCVSLVRGIKLGAVNLFKVRAGKLWGKENFLLNLRKEDDESEAIKSFLEQYYSQTQDFPKSIVIKKEITPPLALEKLTRSKILVAQRGRRRKLLNLGEENAEDYLKKTLEAETQAKEMARKALSELTAKLKLPKIPQRIEAYDISNLQGEKAVGSLIVFTNGFPDKSQYRKFKIKTVFKPDDPKMMAEVVERRFKHVGSSLAEWPHPDLVILDGGKGQLGIVRRLFLEKNIQIPLLALAKKREEIFLPGKKEAVILPPASLSLHLLMRIRDEAHRFAISYFKSRFQKESFQSLLDEIPGLGPKRKKQLFQVFGSLAGIQKAPAEQLNKIIGEKLTQTLKEYL